ncbi:YfbU family protein [Paenarthrobacter ureafaciens]|uniref:YfbU family protein n=1 Tax=Paenarthrobacter ureafaciens TaxID=37931 RepID=UPI001FB28AF3|nr:YfbU family protein [Paenarthrobacter ureafaciens]UOD83343.1 YfbU family protein [Paenarthrobacter ureafaciens]WNZ04325.1 YfbU family protein [Paenarthrobacter ureafaciens]
MPRKTTIVKTVTHYCNTVLCFVVQACDSEEFEGMVLVATVTLRLSDETKKRIEQASEARAIPVSDYIREALEMHLRLEQSGDVGADRPEDAEEISLTPYQRKVLQLLHRNLLATKGGLEDSYYDHDEEVRALKTLENGFAGEYPHEFADISAPMGRAECELVWDILDMFRVIQASVRKLGKDGWKQLSVDDAEYHGTFQGFDYNDADEVRLANYAKFLIKTDRWTEQSGAFAPENGGGNSHTQMLPTYRAMLRVFKPTWRQHIRGGRNRGYFSANEVQQVLLAAPGATLKGSGGSSAAAL